MAPTASPTAAPVTPSPTPAPVQTLAWECFNGVCTYVGSGGTYVSEGSCALDCAGPPVAPPAAAPVYIPPPTGEGTYSCDCGYGCSAQVGACAPECISCFDVPAPF